MSYAKNQFMEMQNAQDRHASTIKDSQVIVALTAKIQQLKAQFNNNAGGNMQGNQEGCMEEIPPTGNKSHTKKIKN